MNILSQIISWLGLSNFVLIVLFAILIALGLVKREMVDEIMLVLGLIVFMLIGKFYGWDEAIKMLAGFFVAVTVFEFIKRKLQKFVSY